MRGFGLLAVNLCLCGTVLAQSAEVASDDCAVPADIAVYEPGDVDADDLNPWRESLDNELLFRDEAVETAGLTLRVFPDPSTGEVLVGQDKVACPAE